MCLGLILDIIFFIIDIIIPIWNSYNSGKISAYRKGLGKLLYTLGGFLPMSYVLSLIIAIVLGILGYISVSTAVFILSFSDLVFGLEIIVWGVIATYLSAMSTARGGGWKAGIVTAYNAFATIFDAWAYISSFFSNLRDARKAIDSSDFSVIDVIIIFVAALGVGFLITYSAYKEGLKSTRTRHFYY
ncbi:hypothetical protein [Acidianus sp. HS-5]|uniref:hypothetical protein n=1 Tax=Acidianus sp. HS-5 TaxID=2886040 RepID=UPI001F443C09|nr:hypothetical protein [Acidianus sp. HS-5]BDC17115.1 hypothetical protein HS5_00050 [Acidianus sp. HS-5]